MDSLRSSRRVSWSGVASVKGPPRAGCRLPAFSPEEGASKLLLPHFHAPISIHHLGVEVTAFRAGPHQPREDLARHGVVLVDPAGEELDLQHAGQAVVADALELGGEDGEAHGVHRGGGAWRRGKPASWGRSEARRGVARWKGPWGPPGPTSTASYGSVSERRAPMPRRTAHLPVGIVFVLVGAGCLTAGLLHAAWLPESFLTLTGFSLADITGFVLLLGGLLIATFAFQRVEPPADV